MDITLAAAEAIIDAAGELRYRRPLTDAERMFGDVDRVARDFDAAEQVVADAARPVMRRMFDQLLIEARPLLAARDVAGLARLRASHTAELAAALKDAARSGMDAGAEQVRENAAGQRKRFAARPRKTPRKPLRKQPDRIPEWLDARSEAVAESVAAQQAAAMSAVLQRQTIIGDGTLTDADIEAMWAGGEKTLVGTATSLGREAYGLGRLIGLDELAASGDVDHCLYTAILDDATCEVCEAMDGVELPADELDAAPNDECLGVERCRCFVIAVLKTGDEA